jgi:RNA polymerase sigma-70 factor (ECF subfamily)
MAGAVLPWRVAGFAAALRADPALPPRATGVEPSAGALRDRDPWAWRALFEREMPAIFRYARLRLGDVHRAEDATAEVFEQAWRSVDSFEERGLPARAWLFGIARNVVGSHRRWLFKQPPQATLEAFDVPDGRGGLSTDRLDLARAIAELEPTHAEVVILRFIHDLSLEATASTLGITVDAVKGRQARALLVLRERIGGDEASR